MKNRRIRRKWIWVGAGVGLALSLAGGQVINWQNEVLGDTVVDSAGEEVSSTYNFELGAFVDGFVPTAENTGLWESNWVRIDSSGEISGTSYVPGTGGFGDSHNYTLEDSAGSEGEPGVGGLQAYVWGYDLRSVGGEWILFTQADAVGEHPAWVFPEVGNVADSTVLPFELNQADTVVLGSITPLGDTNSQFQTAMVIPEPSVAVLLSGAALVAFFILGRARPSSGLPNP